VIAASAQVGAIDAGRLGDLVGHVTPEQQWGIDEALATVLGLGSLPILTQ
jgi:mRNA interferase MazF